MYHLLALILLMAAPCAWAADSQFGVLDVELGASYLRLERELDFRDISTALAQLKGGKPDLGKRGYGCMKREDAFADVGCVSHQEKLDGVETREIRLHFLAGRLQQFSLSAEARYFDAVIAYLRRRHGEPIRLEPGDPAGGLQWRNDAARITAHRGKDLVFVSFELASYAEAVKRKREGVNLECS